MFIRLTYGTSFAAAISYAERNSEAFINGHMLGDTPDEFRQLSEFTKQLKPKIKEPVIRGSLSLTAEESLSPNQWRTVTEDFVERMGMGKSFWCAFLHRDTDNEHVHIVASRIALDGKVWHPEFDLYKCMRIRHELEQAHGLTDTRREVYETGRSFLQRTIDDVMKVDRPQTWDAFVDHMAYQGIEARAQNGGVIFDMEYKGGRWLYKGSKVGWPKKELDAVISREKTWWIEEQREILRLHGEVTKEGIEKLHQRMDNLGWQGARVTGTEEFRMMVKDHARERSKEKQKERKKELQIEMT